MAPLIHELISIFQRVRRTANHWQQRDPESQTDQQSSLLHFTLLRVRTRLPAVRTHSFSYSAWKEISPVFGDISFHPNKIHINIAKYTYLINILFLPGANQIAGANMSRQQSRVPEVPLPTSIVCPAWLR